MTRIAIVTDRHPPSWGGGVSSAHYHLSRLLANQGFDVSVFALFDPAKSDTNAFRAFPPSWYLNLLRRLNSAFFKLFDNGLPAYQVLDVAQRGFGAIKLRRALQRFNPDVVIFPDHGSAALWMPTKGTAKRIMIAHHNPSRFDKFPGIGSFSALDVRIASWLEQTMLRQMDVVVCPSHYMQKVFRESYAFGENLEVIPNLIDPVFLQSVTINDPRQDMGLSQDTPLIYLPAAGNKFKGSNFIPGIVCELAASHSFGLYLSGHVSKETVRELARHCPVFAPGPQKGDDVLAIVKACSFGIYPTLVENYSMALLEAALIGVPMLGFDVGGNSEIIKIGVNGFLAPSYDTKIIIEQAARLLSRPEYLAELRADTYRDSTERLSASLHLGRWLALFAA